MLVFFFFIIFNKNDNERLIQNVLCSDIVITNRNHKLEMLSVNDTIFIFSQLCYKQNGNLIKSLKLTM